jgi:hypothetical protein
MLKCHSGSVENLLFLFCPLISLDLLPGLAPLRQEDEKFKVSLGYTVRLCLKKPKTEIYFIGF